VKRGEIWTQSGGPGYAGKPRPVLILQSDLLDETDSVITCLFTTHDNGEIPSRVPFPATAANGLLEDSDLMAEKVTAVSRSKLGRRLGAVGAADLARVQAAVMLVLGFEE
jgi:mRNA interferase MazF